MKFLREPLLHFLVLGALIFWLSRDPGGESMAAPSLDNRITIPAATIRRLAAEFEQLQAREPTAAELRQLIDRRVLDEAYTREAFRRGLHLDDPIVARRLREKMQVVAEESTALPEPDDATLRAFLEAHPDTFREEPRVDLRQIFFDPGKLGPEPGSQLATALGRLRDGESVDGHETLLPSFRADAPLRSITATFGADFADRVAALPVDHWSGPLRSGFGWHLVKVEDRTPGRVPPLEAIRDEVREEWKNAEARRRLEAFNRGLLDDFEVEIQWPGPTNNEP